MAYYGIMYVMAAELLRITIRNMPRDLWRRVRLLAFERNVAMYEIVIEALERYLHRVEGKK